MRDFPPHDGLPAFDERASNARAWLGEYSAQREIPLDAGPPPTGSNPLIKARPYDRDPAKIQPGAIRVLSSFLTADLTPRYFLVIGERAPGYPLVTPFSPVAHPATQKELLTRMEPLPLQVLQVWNTRSCPVQLLTEGWHVQDAPEPLVREAREVYARHVIGREDGDVPAPALDGRLGTAIIHPDDPRRDYLRREIAAYAPLLATSQVWVEATAEACAGVIEAPDEREEVDNLIRFPEEAVKGLQFPELAAADDDDAVVGIQVDQPLSLMLQANDDGRLPPEVLAGPAASFSAACLAVPERLSEPERPDETGRNAFGCYRPTGTQLDLPHGLPFLVLDRETGTIGGIGHADADRNLEITHASEHLLRGDPGRRLLLLPAR